MKILIACEFSGVVREAFKAKGHDVWSCDLLPTEIPGQHIQGDVLEQLDKGWDMMIAHPPCTYLSNAGACRLYPKKGQIDPTRYQKGLQAKEFFLQLWNCNIPRVCIENPVSSSVFKMPFYTQQIQPFYFGHPCTKKTRLWLRNLPELQETIIVMPTGPYCPAGTSRKDPSKLGYAKRGEDAKNRSRTFIGIAEAMADQWGSL